MAGNERLVCKRCRKEILEGSVTMHLSECVHGRIDELRDELLGVIDSLRKRVAELEGKGL